MFLLFVKHVQLSQLPFYLKTVGSKRFIHTWAVVSKRFRQILAEASKRLTDTKSQVSHSLSGGRGILFENIPILVSKSSCQISDFTVISGCNSCNT